MNISMTKSIFIGLGVLGFILSGFSVAVAAPYMNLSSYYIYPGQNFGVMGGGFAANSFINLGFLGENKNTLANTEGDFGGVEFTVPYNAVNSTVEVAANSSSQSVVSKITIAGFYPNVTPNSWYFPRGGKVSFTGVGFAPNEKIIVMANGQNRGELDSNNSGFFSSTDFDLPYQGGAVEFTFTGEKSKASSSRTVTVASNQPHVVFNTYYAGPGSKVTVTGHDFGAGEAVNLNFEGLNFGSPIANANGYFSHEITIPNQVGQKSLVATGLVSGLKASADFTISGF